MIEDLERLYRGMTVEQIEAHEDWVRRFKAERAVEEAKVIEDRRADFSELVAKVAPMTDLEVVEVLFDRSITGMDAEADGEKALQVLQAAEFVRGNERAKAAEQALVGLTPDGSEFYRRNPDREGRVHRRRSGLCRPRPGPAGPDAREPGRGQ